MSAEHPVNVGEGDIDIVLLPGSGARLHRLRVRGQDLLRTPAKISEHARDPFFWGGYVMAPWCGRLVPGPVVVGGRVVDLSPNFPDGSAIHGQVFAAPWRQVDDAAFAIDAGGDHWPWRYRAEMAVTVRAMTLSIVLRLTNLDEAPMPGGIGLHPWFRLPVEVAIHSEAVYASNSDPSPLAEAVSGELDLRRRQRMANGVDATWLHPADPALELFWPEGGFQATVRAPVATLHIAAACAAERGAIAAEPQTHAPNGLRRLLHGEPGALALIDPGATIELPITLAFSSFGESASTGQGSRNDRG
jgi:aldose 1-epimerase